MKKIIIVTLLLFVVVSASGQTFNIGTTKWNTGFKPTKEDSLRLNCCTCDSILANKTWNSPGSCDSTVYPYTGAGFWKLYGVDGHPSKCGYFENYNLLYGLEYFYKENKLRWIYKYFNGKYAGNCKINYPLTIVKADYDSLFIVNVKKYSFKEFGTELKGDFYTKWKTNEDPYYVLFISRSDTVLYAPNYTRSGQYPLVYCKSESDADWQGTLWRKNGYHTFTYKTYANSSTELTSHFLSYSNEAKCFIIFHELLHNYIHQQKIKIPYEFHEALGDVVGNYGALSYAKLTLRTDINSIYKQIDLNEKIYECLNGYIAKITPSCTNIPTLNTDCYRDVQLLLEGGDTFQKDRFANGLNNAYLLKNMNYCKNYFLLKRVLLKQGSIMKLLEIIKTLPESPSDCVQYLEAFAENK